MGNGEWRFCRGNDNELEVDWQMVELGHGAPACLAKGLATAEAVAKAGCPVPWRTCSTMREESKSMRMQLCGPEPFTELALRRSASGFDDWVWKTKNE